LFADMPNPQETAKLECEKSSMITAKLRDKIFNQNPDYNARNHQKTWTIENIIQFKE